MLCWLEKKNRHNYNELLKIMLALQLFLFCVVLRVKKVTKMCPHPWRWSKELMKKQQIKTIPTKTHWTATATESY